MAIDRRSFLIGSALALVAGRGDAAVAGTDESAASYVSACRRADGSHAVALLMNDGRFLREIPLSARGHDIAVDKEGHRAVAFARQPGRFAVAFDPRAAEAAPDVFAPPENRMFFGHGAFSPDGRILYATENDIDTGAGKIGLYDVTGRYARIGELDSHGIGPHEVLLLADGATLAIANGGYETLPESGRSAVALAEMKPSLAFVDARSGALLAKHELPGLQRLSIRHLAEGAGGTVWFGGQWEGATQESPELLGFAGRDAGIRLLRPERPLGAALKGYIGSVAISRDRRTIAASAPRAGRIVLIDAESAAVRGMSELADGCGLALHGGAGFLASSGHGALVAFGDAETQLAAHPLAFDNHLRTLGV